MANIEIKVGTQDNGMDHLDGYEPHMLDRFAGLLEGELAREYPDHNVSVEVVPGNVPGWQQLIAPDDVDAWDVEATTQRVFAEGLWAEDL